MRSALWLFLSPFAMVGGWLIGWFGHALALQSPIDVNLAADVNQQMVLAGICLILLGGYIRHFMMGRMKKEIKAQSVVIGATRSRIEEVKHQRDQAESRLAIIREMIEELPDERIRQIMFDDDEEA